MDRVLQIDDDIDIFKLIENFAKSEFSLEHASSLAQAKSSLEKNIPAVVILDIELEDGNGIDFLLQNKSLFEKNNVSVLMLSKHDQLAKKLESFELGAVDFIKKPFEPMELIARVKASLKRNNSSAQSLVKKDLTLELYSGRAYITSENSRKQIDLSPTEFKLLLLMLKNENQIFSREQLIDSIWSDNINITDRTIDQHISKLRKKLTSRYYKINTKHGLGYSIGPSEVQ